MEKCCRAGQATDDSIIGRMRIACWISKATDTHLKYVIHIFLPRQQWLRELSAPVLISLSKSLTVSLSEKTVIQQNQINKIT
jgi:hypothetical protein